MLVSALLILGAAQADDFDCHSAQRHWGPVVRSWFDEPNSDPWPGLTLGADTAAWTRLTRTLEQGWLPMPGAVRPEELMQALPTDEPPPENAQELAVRVETASSPWESNAALVRITLTARRARFLDRPPAHLVLVVDELAQDPTTLSVARDALRSVVSGLRHDDTVSIVASGGVREVLPPTRVDRRATILAALDDVHAVVEADLPASLEAAWARLEEAPSTDLRRVIVVSDGELSLLMASTRMQRAAAQRASEGIGLVGLGFGERHGRDDSVEAVVTAAGGPMLHLAHPFDGTELADHLGAVLEPAATDVRALVEWDPHQVVGVHRVGNHLDRLTGLGPREGSVGGELGVGQTASILYEVRLKPGARGDVGTVTVRDRPSFGGVREREAPIEAPLRPFVEASADFRIAVAAASLGELLAETQSAERLPPERVVELARASVRPEYERDLELVRLAERAAELIEARGACLAKAR